MADPHFVGAQHAAGSARPYGLSPNQIREAYGLGTYTAGVLSSGINFSGIQGDGRGQTIAIVDAYDDPNALSDLNAFSSYFGLPTFGAGGPTFQKLNQNGGTSLPGTDPSGPGNSWEMEEALDIEWAHVMAPLANIILFEATDSGNGLFTAVRTAARTSGVVAVSMSWSGSEFSGESSLDSLFTTPAGHIGGSATVGGAGLAGGVTFLDAAGDSGAFDSADTSTITPQYPGSSPNVVAVGGTSLTVNGRNPNYTYGGETAWGNGADSGNSGGGGGGISAFERQPAYQNGVVSALSTSLRTYPDVSADADPSSGVPLYDSWDFDRSTPWIPGYLGGTSLATPLWAGIIAVADEGRAIAGQGSLDGATQTLPDLYKLPATTGTETQWHDITSGNNGYPAGPGYDLASGLGSPVGNLLIPALIDQVAPATTGPTLTITGTSSSDQFIFDDSSGSVVVALNGVIQTFAPGTYSRYVFHGVGGSAILAGGAGANSAVFYANGSGQLSNSAAGFTVSVDGMTSIHAVGHAGDVAQFNDSPQNDVFYAYADYNNSGQSLAGMYASGLGGGYSNSASGFSTNLGYSTNGGNDTAAFFDTPQSDTFYAYADYSGAPGTSGHGQSLAGMYGNYGSGQSSGSAGYSNSAKGFSTNVAYSTNGGTDTAAFFDSPGNDTFYAYANYRNTAQPLAGMYGSGYNNSANGFGMNFGFSTNGGNDTASLTGSSGANTLNTDLAIAQLYGSNFFQEAAGFAAVNVFGGSSTNNHKQGPDPLKYALFLNGSWINS